jgi:serine protease Do/serine protease DegQ
MQDITPELASAFDLPEGQGAIVTQVFEDSAAEEAGLKVGDVVISANDTKLSSADTLRNMIGLLMVGQTIELEVLRNGKKRSLTAKVKPTEKSTSANVHAKLSGATFGDIEPSAPYYGKVDGIVVYSVKRGSAAWQAGLRANDIITSVNRQRVESLEQFKPLAHSSESLLLNIIRQGNAMFLLLK